MRWLLIVVLLATACKRKETPPKNDFEAFERKYVVSYQALAYALRKRGQEVPDKDIPSSYRAIYIGAPGVFVDRKLVATLPEIATKRAELAAAIDANAKLLPTVGFTTLTVTFDLGPQPASVAIEALRLFVGRETYFNKYAVDPEVPLKVDQTLCGSLVLRGAPSSDREAAQLSVFLDSGRTWVGLSRLNEFQEIPDLSSNRDLEKLKDTLRSHKASSFFQDRNDIELAASSGTAADVIGAVEMLCSAGFNDIAILGPDQLSARPSL